MRGRVLPVANNGQTGCAVIAWRTDGQTPCDVTVSPDGGSIERLLWLPTLLGDGRSCVTSVRLGCGMCRLGNLGP